jgi:hypothetical protein
MLPACRTDGEGFTIPTFDLIPSDVEGAVYLSPADKSHRLTRRLSQRAKRPIREGSHSLPAAL